MSALQLTALILSGFWLGVLTLAVLLLVRQVSVLTVRLDIAIQQFSPSNDWLAVGAPVPEEVTTALPQLREGLHYILALSATCEPCRDLVAQFDGQEVIRHVLALVSGPPERAENLIDFLPPSVEVIRDPRASSLLRSLQIRSTPYAVEMENGIVSGTVFPSEVTDLFRLMAARAAKDRSRRRDTTAAPEVNADVGSG
jgi:hypothetical protein